MFIAEKQNPGEFGNVLQGSGTVGTAHDVADGFDVAVEALLGVEFASVAVTVFCCTCHGVLIDSRSKEGD